MLVLLTVPPWLALVLAAGRSTSQREARRLGTADWRDALLLGTVLSCGLLVITTELLGACHGLRPLPLRILWLGAAVISVGWIWRRRREWVGADRRAFQLRGPDLWLLLGLVGLLAAAALVTALASPPTHPDVLEYHLPRQLMWLQQGSLDFFPTPDPKLLRMPPLAEIVGLNLLVLGGGDAYANLPGFLCYLLTAVAVSVLARDLGGGLRSQLLATFLWASVPMAYQEASSGKNDLMTALWVGLLAIQALRAAGGQGFSPAEWAALGGTLGLCWLTKGTGLIYSFPIVVFLGWRLARRGALGWKGPVLAAAIALLLVGNHYRRNWTWFGAPLGHAVSMERDEMNHRYTPGAFASNLVRDIALQLPTPSEALNRAVQHGIERLHHLLHQGIDDPRTSLVAPGAHYEIRYQPNYDTLTAAPLHALLALVLPFWLWGSGRGGRRAAWILLGLAAAGLCLFAAAAKWQPWGARLELPLFVLIVPVAGWLGATRDRIGWGGWMAAIGAALALLPALNIYERPLWGSPNVFTARREELEFRFWPSLRASQDAVDSVLGDDRIRCVRFAMDQMNWSYPMMRRLLDQRSDPPVFWGPKGSPVPDAVVDYPGPDRLPLEMRQPGSPERYLAVGNTAPYLVYLREGLLLADPAAGSGGLPSFIGWSASAGLTAVTIGTAHGPIEGRVAGGEEIQLSGPFAGPGSILRADVRVLREPLRFLVESGHRSLAEVVVAQSETRRIEVRVGAADEIVLRPVGTAWGDRNLIFLRLQVLDPSLLPPALRAAR